MSKIIIDTCVLYELGSNNTLFEKVKHQKLCPNWINLRELTTTGNLIKEEEKTRAAVQIMFSFQKNTIFIPPPLYVVQDSQEIDFDIMGTSSNNYNITDMLKSTEKIAQGYSIDPIKKADFFARNKEIKLNGLDVFAHFLNLSIKDFRKKRVKILQKKTRLILKKE